MASDHDEQWFLLRTAILDAARDRGLTFDAPASNLRYVSIDFNKNARLFVTDNEGRNIARITMRFRPDRPNSFTVSFQPKGQFKYNVKIRNAADTAAAIIEDFLRAAGPPDNE